MKSDPQKRKNEKTVKNFNSKQIINQTSNIISTNKSWHNSYKLKIETRKILCLVSA